MSFWNKLFGSSSSDSRGRLHLADAVPQVPLDYTLDSAISSGVDAGDLAKVRVLLERGANVNAAPNKGRVTLLHSAASYGHKDVVKLLLAKGANVHAKCINDITPLYSAASGAVSTIETQGHRDVVKLLLAHGADVNAKNDYGWTPLYVANYYERRATAELLRQNGGQE